MDGTRGTSNEFSALAGKRVLITGHTGFKGAWLAEWLLQLGGEVHGIALAPEAPGSLFERLGLAARLRHVECDITDAEGLSRHVREAAPDVVFHLAAQALVRRSYRDPLRTWTVNVIGTLNVLEAVRASNRPARVVAVTTDKVYRNREWPHAYRESDELGGHDPYSASKAACEIAVASWRASFAETSGVRVATARAGNVLGGGDHAEDRIVPDCYRSWSRGAPVALRHPHSTRPWQHVLEPLGGYIRLADHLNAAAPVEAVNFGPGPSGDRRVHELVSGLARLAPDRVWNDESEPGAVHEAKALSLAIDLARHRLAWQPLLSFDETLQWVDRGYSRDESTADVVRDQIHSYQDRRTV
ncbi:MAG: CDP-glucose 4,6-dehydratase [Gemmatimonadaceae bacterium]|nr:CDP-glucose 4,6-dehydratase [Gemmatimonadaceae bacterium]